LFVQVFGDDMGKTPYNVRESPKASATTLIRKMKEEHGERPSPMVRTQKMKNRVNDFEMGNPRVKSLNFFEKKSMGLPQRPHGGRGICKSSLKIQSTPLRKVR
jgi:hypothetical protein